MKMKRNLTLLVLVALLLSLCACAQGNPTPDPAPDGDALSTIDPSGAEIAVPAKIESIVVLAPSLSEILVDLGLGDKITGYDLQSVGIEGLPAGVPTFDTVNPDVEQLTALAPDVLLVSSLSLYDQQAPYQPLIDAGVCVICVPTSESIEDVKSDIRFLAEALGVKEQGEALVSELETQLNELAAIAATIPAQERKTVYFEISAAPYMYSTGSGTYLHEMIEWIGGENILADQTGWLNVEGEAVVAADPDVIFTNVNYIDDPVNEILGRDGWAGLKAITGSRVYYIDNMSSSLPNHNIIVAMRQMAEALYPDYYAAK